MSTPAEIAAAMAACGLSADQVAAVLSKLQARSAGADRQARYRARLDVCLDEWDWLRSHVFARDEYRCAYCGADVKDFPQCDHVVPRSRGGKSVLDNLATACKACNSGKRDRALDEWLARA